MMALKLTFNSRTATGVAALAVIAGLGLTALAQGTAQTGSSRVAPAARPAAAGTDADTADARARHAGAAAVPAHRRHHRRRHGRRRGHAGAARARHRHRARTARRPLDDHERSGPVQFHGAARGPVHGDGIASRATSTFRTARRRPDVPARRFNSRPARRWKRPTSRSRKGGVITGIVVDDNGEATPRTQVRAMRYVMRTGEKTLQQAGTGSDRRSRRISHLRLAAWRLPRERGSAESEHRRSPSDGDGRSRIAAAAGAGRRARRGAWRGAGGGARRWRWTRGGGGGGRGGAAGAAGIDIQALMGGGRGGGPGGASSRRPSSCRTSSTQQEQAQTVVYAPVYYPGTRHAVDGFAGDARGRRRTQRRGLPIDARADGEDRRQRDERRTARCRKARRSRWCRSIRRTRRRCRA